MVVELVVQQEPNRDVCAAVNRPYHQPNGFDHARELDLACRSIRMGAPLFAELTFQCSNCVTNMWPAWAHAGWRGAEFTRTAAGWPASGRVMVFLQLHA